jgi:UTP-glucose-1-phosphate uridylyltransferase
LFINILNTQAWQYMGLRINPATKKIEKDMEKAIVAIDIIAYLIDNLEKKLSEEERTGLRSLLSDLQINFVRQQKPSEDKSEQK